MKTLFAVLFLSGCVTVSPVRFQRADSVSLKRELERDGTVPVHSLELFYVRQWCSNSTQLDECNVWVCETIEKTTKSVVASRVSYYMKPVDPPPCFSMVEE